MNVLESLIKESGFKNKKFIEVLELSAATWQKKRESPEQLNVVEINKVAQLLNMMPDQLFNILLNEHIHKNTISTL